MAEIKEVFEDIKDTVGDKGFYILIAVVVFFFIYNLRNTKTTDSSDTLTPVTTVSSYPDTVTNANVIIDTLQDSIDYSEGIITEQIESLGNDINVKFEATNNYIEKGMESQSKLFEENFDDIQGSIKNVANAVKKSTTATTNKSSTTSSKKTSTTATKKDNTKYYTYKTKSGLNTSSSIVDALKAIGVDSSLSYRTKIATANGIKNYKGTSTQNIKMLSLLKSGKLKQV